MVTNVLYICFLCFGSTVCGFSVRFFPSSVAGGGDGECVYALAPTCLKTFGVIVWMILLWRKAQTQPNRMKRYEIGVCVCVFGSVSEIVSIADLLRVTFFCLLPFARYSFLFYFILIFRRSVE